MHEYHETLLGGMSKVQQGILREVLKSGQPLTRAAIAETLGYHPRTPTFRNAVHKLHVLGFLHAKGGNVAATDLLYPAGLLSK